jgi:hypothetical protein
MRSRKSAILTPTDDKPKKKMKVMGGINMSGPEKLLMVKKATRGAAKKTGSSRVKHKKTVY